MEVFAIRVFGTTKYLPMRKKSRGFSYDEPTDEKPPRLFYTKRSAQNALTAWLQGVWENHTVTSGYYGEDVDVYPEPKKVEGRQREMMEIVKFQLHETN
jgi:hypothetical protein